MDFSVYLECWHLQDISFSMYVVFVESLIFYFIHLWVKFQYTRNFKNPSPVGINECKTMEKY